MWVPFNVHDNRVPCCSMRAPRKTCFVSATWKRFLIIKFLLLSCVYPFVRTFLDYDRVVLFYLFMSSLSANQNPKYMESSMMFFFFKTAIKGQLLFEYSIFHAYC